MVAPKELSVGESSVKVSEVEGIRRMIRASLHRGEKVAEDRECSESYLWESIGALISTGSLNSGIQILSIRFTWRPPRKCVNSDYISSGLELVLGKTEVLDPLLEAFFDQLTTLSLDMRYAWPINLHDELYNEALTHFSQPAIEGVLRKNLPRISQMVCLNVSVSHSKEL